MLRRPVSHPATGISAVQDLSSRNIATLQTLADRSHPHSGTCWGLAIPQWGLTRRHRHQHEPRGGAMSNAEPVCELHNDGENVYVLVNGLKIAKRGAPH